MLIIFTRRYIAQDLRDAFYSFGELRSIRMVPGKDFAFVQFTTRHAAETAAEELYKVTKKAKHVHHASSITHHPSCSWCIIIYHALWITHHTSYMIHRPWYIFYRASPILIAPVIHHLCHPSWTSWPTTGNTAHSLYCTVLLLCRKGRSGLAASVIIRGCYCAAVSV